MLKKFYKFYVTALALAASSAAMSNDVYMEQIGSGNVVTVTQQGAGNLINSGGVASTSKAYLNTQGATVTIDQIGAQNTLSLEINNSAMAAAGAGMNITVKADGSGNFQNINCGTALSAGCAASTITSMINGDSNTVTQNITGNGLSSIINVTGNANQVTHTTSGAGSHTGDITVSGGSNLVSLVQSGGLAKSATITHTGSNNTISVTQSD